MFFCLLIFLVVLILFPKSGNVPDYLPSVEFPDLGNISWFLSLVFFQEKEENQGKNEKLFDNAAPHTHQREDLASVRHALSCASP